MKCRGCLGSDLSLVLDLGTAPPSNFFLTSDQLREKEGYYPLAAALCTDCCLLQLTHVLSSAELFSATYPYFSSYSHSWLTHAERYAEMAAQRFGLTENSLVIELASNDGYLLQYFMDRKIQVLGIEPSASTAEVATRKGIPTVIDFFSARLARELVSEYPRFDLLVANNVLAHVPDLHDFVSGIKIVLADAGCATLEFPHLLKLLEFGQFDTVYHEHFSYFSLAAVIRLFTANGLRVFDVEELNTHGGSLRVYVCHTSNQEIETSDNCARVLQAEQRAQLLDPSTYASLRQTALNSKFSLLGFLMLQKEKGKLVIGYGAAAKGNTLLNYSGVKADLLPFVVDASPWKAGKFMPGSRIPVRSLANIEDTRPDFILILPWNIRDEIVDQLDFVRAWGAKFVLTVPNLEVF